MHRVPVEPSAASSKEKGLTGSLQQPPRDVKTGSFAGAGCAQ